MLDLMKRRTVDLLVEQFWKHGYLTLSRKFGTYLPEPTKVGEFEVDIIARHKKNYAIGITLNEDDINSPKLIEKIVFLATRHTKYTNKKVMLFVGVPVHILRNFKALLNILDPEVKKNIRVIQIIENTLMQNKRHKNKESVLFS